MREILGGLCPSNLIILKSLITFLLCVFSRRPPTKLVAFCSNVSMPTVMFDLLCDDQMFFFKILRQYYVKITTFCDCLTLILVVKCFMLVREIKLFERDFEVISFFLLLTV